MMPSERKCTSCGVPLVGEKAVGFNCPSCSGHLIGRCARCRDQSAHYTCPACGYQGP